MANANHHSDAGRIWTDIDSLARITDPDRPWTRRPFTPLYEQGRQWLRERMKEAGLDVSQDAASNIIGRLEGQDPSLPPIMIGSHIDTVTGGGRFDGIAGVVIGIEIARMLKETGTALRHTLEIVDFTAEEPTDFGVSTVGSRGMVGNLSEGMLESRDYEGCTLRDCVAEAGGNPDRIVESARKPGDVSLFLELHIEQGPVLEQSDSALAVVTGIVGIQRYQVTVMGQPDHAGTTPMNLRRDALTAAGELFVALESLCRESYSDPVVGTVGTVEVSPNAANVVPGQVIYKFEVRSINTDVIDQVCEAYKSHAKEVGESRGLDIRFEPLTRSEPVKVPEAIRAELLRACQETVSRVLEIPSGAGHDGNQLARIAPIGMIFVPSRGGRSHCPEEWTDRSYLAEGAMALYKALLKLDISLNINAEM